MHILYLTPYYAPAYAFGGVVRAVEGMAQATAQRGHRVTILTTDALNHDARYDEAIHETRNGVQVIRAPNVSPKLRGNVNLSTPRGMRKIALEILPDVDVIHCHEFRTVENLLVTPIAAELKKPLVMSPHGTLRQDTGRSRLKSWWDTLLSPAVAQRFDHVVGLAQAEIDDVQALWPRFGRRQIPTTFSVIPNGINPTEFTHLSGGEQFREKYGLGSDTVVLFMGRLHARKGVDVLIQAFKQANVPNTRLVIAGPDEGMLDTLKSLVDDRIALTGYLAGDERLSAYAASDVFALPAMGEGLSMAVLEAMGAGLPVILSPGCNLPEAATYGAGIIVEPYIEPLRDALTQILSSTEKRAEMGERARQLVDERFTWEAIAAQLEALYTSLLEGTTSNT